MPPREQSTKTPAIIVTFLPEVTMTWLVTIANSRLLHDAFWQQTNRNRCNPSIQHMVLGLYTSQ
jgi:hypothetical protein